MKLLFVVQRFGADVAGGAETFCREFATRLPLRGAEVDVLTSCATSYVDWANVYPPGESFDGAARVIRLPVAHPRSDRFFGPLHRRVIAGARPTPLYLQQEWMAMQGPFIPDLGERIASSAESYDAVVFFTYLYFTTWAGLPTAAGLTTTVLHPAAHDEAPLYLPLFDLMVRIPHGLGFLSPEERQLVERRFHLRRPSVLTGIGIELGQHGDEQRFRTAYDLGENPFILYVGRLDPHKGTDELFDHFSTYKRRNPGPLKLVAVGDPVRPLPPHPDVITTGFVSESVKRDAIAGCELLVNPSYFESFSIITCEAWAQGVPVLVQGHSEVLAGQAVRSGGGLPYTGYAEFEAALELLLPDAKLRAALGSAGRRYVETTYSWDVVLDRYQDFLAMLTDLTRPSLQSAASRAQRIPTLPRRLSAIR